MARFGASQSQQDLEQAFTSGSVTPVFLVKIHWGGTEYDRLTTAFKPLSYSGGTYSDAGDLLSIASISERADLGASGISISLSAGNQVTLQRARDLDFQGKLTEVYLGALDADGDLIDTTVYFIGYNDTLSVDQSADSNVITLNVENKLMRLSKKNIRRYTEEDQKQFLTGGFIGTPTAFEFVNYIADKPIKW